MKHNKIRLTESQLHSIIKESVRNILKEIKLGGESLHGDKAEDWSAMEKMRDFRLNGPKSRRERTPKEMMHDVDNSLMDLDNANSMHLKNHGHEHASDFNKSWHNMRDKASEKAIRMQKNLGWR